MAVEHLPVAYVPSHRYDRKESDIPSGYRLQTKLREVDIFNRGASARLICLQVSNGFYLQMIKRGGRWT